MKSQSMKDWWSGYFQKKHDGPVSKGGDLLKLRVASLTVGLRVPFPLHTGIGRRAETTHFLWVSPQGSYPPGNALKVLLNPN